MTTPTTEQIWQAYLAAERKHRCGFLHDATVIAACNDVKQQLGVTGADIRAAMLEHGLHGAC